MPYIGKTPLFLFSSLHQIPEYKRQNDLICIAKINTDFPHPQGLTLYAITDS